ncbi:DUF2218 domain-containing protein [Novosphingobium cyanobacteriorum]|uniref:DUF2218 domain-containing protein n=1 Tax=Novosphingobium cyanobacteriorum TaxID=3024215 RepID=A0ABT6CEM8_9SPHN|nr:DUF2218 domain-containing protein [Novosphingobium cyanobacteriorum]MDF8332376.1 DUF2218 domain-containing protein [Novosphingobium cyanobacteriorum]
MSTQSTARIPTTSASRYLQQVCKHWEHNLEVSFDATQGRIVFPRDARGATWAGDAMVTFTAEPEALVCTITASEPAQLEGLKGAVARHVDRFAFREAPLSYPWVDA